MNCFFGHQKHVTLTYAQSIDGCIAAKRGQPVSISSPESFEMTHNLRKLHQAIAVGVGTIIADNPSLTTRLVEGENPQPIVFDTLLRCPPSCKLFTDERCLQPILIASSKVNEDKEALDRYDTLTKLGATIWKCPVTVDNHIDINAAIDLILENFDSVMIEGGASIITSILTTPAKSKLTSIVLTIAPIYLGGLNAVQVPLFDTSVHEQPTRMEMVSQENMGGDIVVCYRIK